ncbi:hypothetical protein G4B88_011079 [Cannabis sativa]|uniref:Zinc knuckle CX2CX4HX4C domain-containing protein n=1 Tax=Cannabis sativa TaxID=3483 RepID=A0A7J6FB13_CANSA|nr:hypothetical protein G4B88_011079 [Cannabis sativa]
MSNGEESSTALYSLRLLVNVPPASLKGKCFTCVEASISLVPCATSQKALSSLCLHGKVVAPMLVDADAIIEFVTKHWQKKIGFECVEDRDCALQNAPWLIRGYTFALHAWVPSIESSSSLNVVRLWVQFHNHPHEYFSIANGNLLGGRIGDVIQVELDEEKPATWGILLRASIDINIQNPLVSCCFFDLLFGGKRWIQFKYEKIGIFCYNFGRLGHQRRGCSLSSPVSVENVHGSTHPLFGPWLSMASRFHDVFSGGKTQAGLFARGGSSFVVVNGGEAVRPMANVSCASKK